LVKTHKMKETEIDNRGSKSEFITKMDSVKEQRVDGSLCFNKKHIRYTLTGLETGYQLKILSKQLTKNKRTFSTLISNSKLNP
jgi:hypothetical protein